MDWQDPDTRGMVRNPDHETSEAAADTVARRKGTIRTRVLLFAENRPHGFIDEDLRRLDPDSPESSFRKRRSELTDDCVILDSGLTRMNSQCSLSKVWVHRKFHPNPPAEKVKARGRAAHAIQRNKREAIMFNALVTCAGYFCGMSGKQGQAVAEALGIDHPIRYSEIPALLPL